MSISTHLGYERSRRDDLEAIGYLLIYFLRGSLPWQSVKANTMEELNRKIGEVKQSTKLKELCGDYPEEFTQYITYARNLDFAETPDYKKLILMFGSLMKEKGWSVDWEFDWVKKNDDQVFDNYVAKLLKKNA